MRLTIQNICIIFVFAGLLSTSSAWGQGRFDEEIAAFEARDLETPPLPGGTVFTGSSTIRLWPNLEEAFADYRTLNRGFGGSEVSDLIYYYESIINAYEPQVVVLYSGDNDLWKGKTPEQVAQDFQILKDKIRTDYPDTLIMVLAIKPSPARLRTLAATKEANDLLQQWCAESEDPMVFVDTFLPLMDGDRPDPAFYAEDNLHLNEDGYRQWWPLVDRALRDYWQTLPGSVP